jgi:murein DD-endopeptidase MepM/ murein hydrolase activator NlpD
MVNIDARRERHARLKQENIQLKRPLNPMNATSAALRSSIQQLCRDQNGNPLIGKFLKRIIGFTLAFLMLSPFISTYQLTQGSYMGQFAEDDMSIYELTEQGAEYTIADVMTEDGFLLKPAINSTEGDRSGFSDIFVYTVEPGDTLSSIAESFNLKKETLMGENNIWNPNRLRVGSKIKILPVGGLSHVVKKDETLDKLAKKYKVEKETIITQNQLEDETLIADTALIIPGAKREVPVYLTSTAPANAASYSGPSAVGRLIWPTVGKVTQGYRRGHLALDIGNRSKGPIYAAAPGKVIKAQGGWNGGYGNVVIIDHGNGMQTLYAHNEKLYVTKGQYVEQGQTIAWMGRTGRVYGVTGIHLHFEVRIKGVKYNPMSFF